MTIAAVLLAGGESKRMGTPKPLLEWQGTTLIEYQVSQLQQLPADRVVVVLGHRADEVRPLVHKLGAQCVINELYREGRASSVRVAAAALPNETECVMVLNVDQPRPVAVTKRLVEAHRASDAAITIPRYEGQRGHPTVFDGSLLPEMRDAQEATQGLREILRLHEDEIEEVEFSSPIVLLDLNDPSEYEAALERYSSIANGR